MQLREHPRIRCRGESSWPPQWKGPFGPHNPLPTGEVGVLIRVDRGSDLVGEPHCVLVMEWNRREYFGSVYFDEPEFMARFVELLQTCIGRAIAEIGSIELDIE